MIGILVFLAKKFSDFCNLPRFGQLFLRKHATFFKVVASYPTKVLDLLGKNPKLSKNSARQLKKSVMFQFFLNFSEDVSYLS